MRISQTQRQRTQNSPLLLGTFDELSVRCLIGSLGPKNQVIGRADTRFTSNGGFGGGEYNHWFQINLASPAWIILVKKGSRPKYINVSAFDLNLNPIQGRSIFDDDSLTETINGEVYHPYVGHVMTKQSALYNNFVPSRLDMGDERYYPLEAGSYLICISTTRNEPITYEVSFVVEFPLTTFDVLQEDFGNILYENNDTVAVDVVQDYVENDLHSHSLSEWQTAWQRDYQSSAPFPASLIPLATQP